VPCFITLPAAGVQAATTCPQSTASVVVHLPSGTQVVTAADLCPLATVDAQYETRSQPGSEPQADPFISAGVPITALLQDVGIDPTTVKFTGAVRTTDGSWSTLTNADLVDPTFANGLVPVVEVNGDSINYVRPLRTDTSDTNATDEIDTDSGVPLQLYAGTGPLLDVASTASPSQARPAQLVTFTATSTPASESPSYTWTFSDGTTAVGDQVTHAFKTPGEYDALVKATGTDGSGGEADPVYVSVGGPPPSQPVATPTPGGGHPSPPSTPKPGPSPAKMQLSSATPQPTPTVSASAPAPLGIRISLPRLATALVNHGSGGQRGPELAPDLPLVRGRLIGDGAVVLSAAGVSVAQSGSASAGRLSASWRAAGLVGSIAAIMLLFAAGAARELRWSRRLRSVVRQR
jgi:hypothetical protein